jgi:ankyrin repeat protein
VIRALSDTIDLNLQDSNGSTACAHAARKDRVNVLTQLKSLGKLQVDIPDNDKNTPLAVAVSWWNFDSANLLMALGADVNAVDQRLDSILHHAVFFLPLFSFFFLLSLSASYFCFCFVLSSSFFVAFLNSRCRVTTLHQQPNELNW